MTDYIPPPRSLLYVRPYPDLNNSLEIGCDCGTVTILTIEGVDRITELHEEPFTCDGCHSTHWFTVGPMDTATIPRRQDS